MARIFIARKYTNFSCNPLYSRLCQALVYLPKQQRSTIVNCIRKNEIIKRDHKKLKHRCGAHQL